MIRRAFLGATAAVALALVPTAAVAYDGSMARHEGGSELTVSEATPVVGAPFAAAVSGGLPGDLLTLAITGKPASNSTGASQATSTRTIRSITKADGVASFKVTLSEAGVYTLTATASDGDVVGKQTVTASAAGAPGSDQASPEGSGGIPVAVIGVALALLAAGAVRVARRRRSEQVPT